MAGLAENKPEPDFNELKARLAELEETLRAINEGEVDAVVVNGPHGPQVYTLEGSDHPFRTLVEEMHEGTVTLDSDGLILYANRHFAAMVEASPETVTGAHFTSFLSGMDARLFAGVAEAAGVRGHSGGELHLLATDGTTVPARISVTTLYVGGMQNLCIVASDLREQRRNEAIIKEEQLSRLILEQAGEAIVVIDPHGIIVRRSASAKSLAGPAMLLNPFDKVFRLTAAGQPFGTEQILATTRSVEPIRSLEVNMMDTAGNSLSLLLCASPLWRDGRELLGSVITLTDITERKFAEEALARQAEELARSNSDLRQFAYSASHDLREPVRQLAVFSEMLQKRYQGNLDPEADRLIQYTVSAALRMESLLKDLLAYMQAAEGPKQVEAPADANQVLRKTLAVLDAQVVESGGCVEWEPLPLLAVHEVHLTQLLQNLIGNALKYRGEAPPMVHISASRAGKMWTLVVADNGIGVEPEYQSQIFGLFQRLHGGGKYTGSGIGLAICQKIVQRYGGCIWVESEPGRGSQFMFTLPAGEK